MNVSLQNTSANAPLNQTHQMHEAQKTPAMKFGQFPDTLALSANTHKPTFADRAQGALRGAVGMVKARFTQDLLFSVAVTLMTSIFSGGLSLLGLPFTMGVFMTFSALWGAWEGGRNPEKAA